MTRPRIAFVLGAPRSGTTLFRVMLAGHPQLFSPPEMILAPFATMKERRAALEVRFWEKGGLRRTLMELLNVPVERAKELEGALENKTIPEVYEHLFSLVGDRMLVDKCPHLSALPDAMKRLDEWYPDARYVWLVRHPGSVTRSLENMPMAEVMLTSFEGEPRDVWRKANEHTRAFLETIPKERWTLVRYEDLVDEEARRCAMERVCATLGVPFHAATLAPYDGDRMREGPPGARAIGDPKMATRGKIQPELATSWLEGFDPDSLDAATHALAKELGYDLSALPPPPMRKVTEGLGALWDLARELEANIRMPADIDAVEGRRFLLRMITASIDTYVEQSDVDRPQFHHAEGPHRKMFADCPDADYLRAPLRVGPGRAYRVRGRVPRGCLYAGIVLYGKGGRVVSSVHDRELELGPNGELDVVISTEPRTDARKWLRAEGDETAVIVRQYFRDRATDERVEVDIQLVPGPPRPMPVQAEELAVQLDRSRRMLKSVFERTVGTYKMARTAALNRFIDVTGAGLFPTPDNRYHAAWYRFGPDQVMLVRGRVPEARYAGFCLYNAWMESFDYTKHRICTSLDKLPRTDDGSFELCIAHGDVGHPAWLETAGHEAGYLLMRELLPTGAAHAPTIEVMYEHELAARLGNHDASNASR